MQTKVELPAAVIFDMDGVLVDSNPYHLEKWIDFLNDRQIPFDHEELPKLILGKRNDTLFRHFLGPDLTRAESKRLSEEIEATFRRVFKTHARPLPGLDRLIQECYAASVPMAVASSAMSKNVEFVVDALGYHDYFRSVVTGDDVDPAQAVAFEDSYVGVGAAKSAGMKCVAVASSFPIEELRRLADLAVPSFEAVNLEKLQELFSPVSN
jgi:beta-phosphoglucomutase